MTNVSKIDVSPKIKEALKNYFTSVLGYISTKKQIDGFFYDFFTYSETIMFQKRLAIILLVHDNIPTSVIQETLKVSRVTIGKIQDEYEKGSFDNIIKTIEKKKDVENFTTFLGKVISVGMPPRGRGRWNWLNDHTGKR